MSDAPLRAFLMLRAADGNWEVSVCRDLAAILSAWGTRQQQESKTGVLHVGFYRPPSHIFADVAREFVGQLLLTESTKYSLPDIFLSSKYPVGRADGMRIYVGLRGWGYEIEDPSIRDAAEIASLELAGRDFRDWVALFVVEDPDAKSSLLNRDIFDDATYLREEKNLDHATRRKLGQYRTRKLAGDSDDPCQVAGACPPWLLERELVTLELPVRALNVFKNYNIRTVKDLSENKQEDLLKKQNFGRKSLRDTLFALNGALDEGPIDILNGEEFSNSGNLIAEVRRSLLSFSERERDVLSRRLGFECAVQTLQDLADDYKVTRERIRQIEVHSIEKWIRQSSWDDVLVQKLARLLTDRQAPVPVAGIEGADSWFDGVSEHLAFFRSLVQVACDNRINVLEIDGIQYLTTMKESTWEKTVSAAESLLESGVGNGWSEPYAQSLVHGLLPDGAKEFGLLLWHRTSRLCHFSAGTDRERTLTSYGRGMEQVVEALLNESTCPLHYSEIAERANIRQGKLVDVRRVHNAASAVGLLFAPGVYGLMRHVPLNAAELLEICAEVEEIILSEDRNRQWHCSELLNVLLERSDREYEGLTKYILNIVLRQSTNLRWLRQMTWAIRQDEDSERKRIDIHQAIVSFVRAAGRPLTTSEIKQNLLAVRGVNETFTITSSESLIPLGNRQWGLNDRDIPISRAQQRELIEELVASLEVMQSGLYREEVATLLNLKDCPVDVFVSIATHDARIKASVGRCIYLAEWGEPRRETIAQSLLTVLKEAREPMRLETVVQLTERRAGRVCEKANVLAAIRAVEAVYDEQSQTWRLGDEAIDDEDEPQSSHAQGPDQEGTDSVESLAEHAS